MPTKPIRWPARLNALRQETIRQAIALQSDVRTAHDALIRRDVAVVQAILNRMETRAVRIHAAMTEAGTGRAFGEEDTSHIRAVLTEAIQTVGADPQTNQHVIKAALFDILHTQDCPDD